jgi:predicted NBD/HSP70 family sugar kinase
MYVGVDIGGTKTLVAALDDNGVIVQSEKFPTPPLYDDFITTLAATRHLFTQDFRAGAVAGPGTMDRVNGLGIRFGNLGWERVPLVADAEPIFNCPLLLDNDANLAGLSESMLLPPEARVLYITISTGIGTGIIAHQTIEPTFADSEGGQMLLEYHGKRVPWEDFASGHAIVERFHKKAGEITDNATWARITHDWCLGFTELIAIIQPTVIVIGGSVGTYFDRYHDLLMAELERYKNPMVPIPEIRQAQRPEEAVVYGCYDLARSHYAAAD